MLYTVVVQRKTDPIDEEEFTPYVAIGVEAVGPFEAARLGQREALEADRREAKRNREVFLLGEYHYRVLVVFEGALTPVLFGFQL